MENIKFIHQGHSSNEYDPVTALLLIKNFHVLDVNFVQAIEINEKSSLISKHYSILFKENATMRDTTMPIHQLQGCTLC